MGAGWNQGRTYLLLAEGRQDWRRPSLHEKKGLKLLWWMVQSRPSTKHAEKG